MAKSGNRRYNPSEYTCGKRRRAETACTIWTRVRAESEEMRKPQVQPGRIHLRKEAKGGNRTYHPRGSTCGKRGDAETAGTIRARVPAERGEERKPHVQFGQEYLRKARRCGNRRHNPGKGTCGKRGDAETAGTIWTRVPAESEEMQKRVYLERIRFAFQRSTMEKTFPVVSP